MPNKPADEPENDLKRLAASAAQHQPWQLDAEEPASEVAPASEAAAPPPSALPPSPKRIVEAFLFAGGPPLTAERATEAIRSLTPAQFQDAVASLNQDYRQQGRPYTIQPREHGYVLSLRPRFRSIVEKLYGGVREARLSQAAIDVLSLVAYRQPVTRQEVESLRGAESSAVLRQLVRRGLIAVVSRGQANAREVAYGTTQRFLELFGLRGLDDLPQTQDLQRL
jgi:segregation and condensation protein B